jgi:hypothetical protein
MDGKNENTPQTRSDERNAEKGGTGVQVTHTVESSETLLAH